VLAWLKHGGIGVAAIGSAFAAVYFAGSLGVGSVHFSKTQSVASTTEDVATTTLTAKKEMVYPAILDKEEYDRRLLALSGFVPPATTTVTVPATVDAPTTTREVPPVSPLIYASTTNVTVKGSHWPAEAPYPDGGAILPFKRIVAYYGNFYSTRMGILGEFEPEVVLAHLKNTIAAWEEADPETPVLPAVEYIASVAQAGAGADGMYRAVMPDAEIEKAYALAQETHGILILDIQIGLSSIEKELPKYRKYLERPDVHLAIDPEFSMKYGNPPGTVIGTFDASDVNYTIDYLADIVKEKQLPPKVLIVHRFTYPMVTNYQNIAPTKEVQVVINMDGWGGQDLKRTTYRQAIEGEPVQFAGIKLFYKNDLKPPSMGILTPAEVLSLHPKPIYIQYQ
jgi:hypothetical protein